MLDLLSPMTLPRVRWISIATLVLGTLAGCDSGSRASPDGEESSTVPRKTAGEDWNDEAIGWMGYEEGLVAAKAEGKPVCLVFFTTWCPHCKTYSRVFRDPRVAEQAKGFVMIRLDKDKNRELSRQYAVDGEYIPRTFFLRPDGTLDKDIRAQRDRHQYFYDERKADGLLAGMKEASEKLKGE